ncbi:Low temperature viability protein [Aspergillus ambiguus]|uniref:ribosome biogenesis protein LTV1 n=1 Tax=Aspergillus ambiguus TaxID=176160 RepID=UPI003CCDD1B5
MPPRKQWIDKKNATTYQLFHRSQHDPAIHDPDADDRVLHQVSGPSAPVPSGAASVTSSRSGKRGQHLSDLASEFGSDRIRKNEGEAANYGIFFDDTEYDYMQHLRELGTGGGDSHFVEAKTKAAKGHKVKLEDALRGVSLNDSASAYGSEMRSTNTSYSRQPTYQDQQDVPDAIAGFQPDMDPRLREALEALDDEEFVDDDAEDDVFGKLTSNAEEMDPGDWEDTLFDEEDYDDDGWESDATEKAPEQPSTVQVEKKDVAPGELPDHDEPAPDMHPEDQGWMREFAKFKKDTKGKAAAAPAAPPSIGPSEQRSTLASTVFTAGGTPIRRKKRKGALTNPSAYSMTSSALARTEGHRLLDDRFDRVEALYALDEEDEYDDSMSMVSGMTGMTGMTDMSTASSQAPSLIDANGQAVAPRHNFNNVMDDFLASWDDNTSAQVKRKGAKAKRGKNGNEAIGIRMLDEVRQGLGPAKLSGRVPGRA